MGNELPKSATGAPVIAIDREALSSLLERLKRPHSLARALPGVSGEIAPPALSFVDEHNAIIGCVTTEVSKRLLAQVISLSGPLVEGMTEAAMQQQFMDATALLGELQPETNAEAMLAAQMIGAHTLAMRFMARASLPTQTGEGVDQNMARAGRLMRLYIGQLEAMAKLKGKSGQQRVVVEHVNVAAGAQAFVGVAGGGGGHRG